MKYSELELFIAYCTQSILLVIGKKKIDEDLLEELEVLLISSDIGIQTTDKVIESVRKKASRKELKDEDSLYQLIKIELESLLISDDSMESSPEIPFVILVVGLIPQPLILFFLRLSFD